MRIGGVCGVSFEREQQLRLSTLETQALELVRR
jgi:hypothetical protein